MSHEADEMDLARGVVRQLDRCPFCAGRLLRRYSNIPDRLETTDERFSVDECAGCGAGVLNPALGGDVSRFYPDHYLSSQDSKGGSDGGVDLEKWYRFNQYHFDFKLLTRATGTPIDRAASYLDVGCGSGERVAYAAERGCARAVGIDKFDFAKRRATQDVEIVNAEILDFRPRAKFEIVSLFHVLEHLDRPREVLTHIGAEVLEVGGRLMIQVPNYGSLERRWFGARWFGLDAPRHYWHFNPAAISRLLEEQGYRVISVFQRNALLHPVTIASSLSRHVDVQRIWVDRARGAAYRRRMTVMWAGLTALTVPVSMFESLCSRGSMLTVVADRIPGQWRDGAA